jgi:hypothetical protein
MTAVPGNSGERRSAAMADLCNSSAYSSALESIMGKSGEWTYSNADNIPDPEFNERAAKRRLKELSRLVRLANEAGYRFDSEYGDSPSWEIRDLESKLFVGPRQQVPTHPPSEMMTEMIDKMFSPSPMLQFLLGKK